MSTRDADVSRKLDAVYEKNAARMRALGVAPETAPETSTNADPDQLEGLLRNFLKANQGESGGVSTFAAAARCCCSGDAGTAAAPDKIC